MSIPSFKQVLMSRNNTPSKKAFCPKNPSLGLRAKALDNTLARLFATTAKPVKPEAQSAPSPAPCEKRTKMITRKICIWEKEHIVRLPEGFDIYEGLNLWYPDLYMAVLEEDEYHRWMDKYRKEEDDIIAKMDGWRAAEAQESYADYMEWLYDD